MEQASGRRVFGTIQLGRWLAAFAVLCFHAAQATTAFTLAPSFGLDRVFQAGFLGVDFFFVLSGFIIYYAHRDDERSVAEFARFGRRRAARVYLPYLPVALVLVLAYAAMPGLSASDRDWSLLKTLTLLPIAGDPALSVAWTLVHELVFYAVFGLLFYAGRLGPGLAAWAALIIGYNATSLDWGPIGSVAFHYLNLEFLMGVAAAHAMKRLPGPLGGAVLLLGALIALPMLVLAPEGPARVVFGLGMALVILGLAVRERDGLMHAPRLARPLGDASYALYLIHVPVLSLTARAGAAAGLGWTLSFVGGLLVCTAAAIAYHRLVERPLVALVRDGLAAPRPIGLDGGTA